jgi:hypothetical protein
MPTASKPARPAAPAAKIGHGIGAVPWSAYVTLIEVLITATGISPIVKHCPA